MDLLFGNDVEGREKYLQAVERENLIRDSAAHNFTEKLAGFEVRQMTLSDFLALRLAGNPFLVGGKISSSDVFAFLWRLSPSYRSGNPLARRWLKFQCRKFSIPAMPRIKNVVSMPWWEVRAEAAIKHLKAATAEISDFVNEALQDWPMSPLGGGGDKRYYSNGVSIIDMLAREYGWTEGYILSRSMKNLLQYMKAIKAFHSAQAGKNPVLSNPSDGVINDWMKTRN